LGPFLKSGGTGKKAINLAPPASKGLGKKIRVEKNPRRSRNPQNRGSVNKKGDGHLNQWHLNEGQNKEVKRMRAPTKKRGHRKNCRTTSLFVESGDGLCRMASMERKS